MFEAKHIGAPEANNNIKSRGQGKNKKKNKVRNESFVLIPGWAVCDYGLKGNELLIYSIIYGFSQEENQTFRGSLRYLMDWTSLGKTAVIAILKKLVEKGLIKKIERFENNVKFCEYYATRLRGGGDDGGGGDGKVPKMGKEDDQTGDEQPGKETLTETSSKSYACSTEPVVQKVNRGGLKSEPNNIVDNIDYSLSKKERETKSFDSLIDDYTENENLRKELKEHLKTRKMKKAALTNRAIELSLKKLDQLAVSDAEKLLIVQNAVMNGWTTFYPLKADEKKQLNDKTSYNLSDYEKTMDTIDEYDGFYGTVIT